MARVNKIICDMCGGDCTSNYHKLFSQKIENRQEVDDEDYIQMDICYDCFNFILEKLVERTKRFKNEKEDNGNCEVCGIAFKHIKQLELSGMCVKCYNEKGKREKK